MAFHHVFQDVPNNRLFAVDNLLCRLDGLYDATLDKLAYNKRLVELGGHVLRKTAFMHLQLRADNDYGTCRIVDTLTEKILAEATLLTFKAVA